MAGLGWQELVIVLVIIMIIFGAGKLPEIAKSLGQGVKEFREEAQAPVVPATARTTGDRDGDDPALRCRWRAHGVLRRRSTGPARRCGSKRFAQAPTSRDAI